MMRAIYPLLYGACLFALWKWASIFGSPALQRVLPWVAAGAGWAWCLLAGGGGFGILLIRGPWPPTNGWFALLSGLVACPLLGRISQKSARLKVSGLQQFSAAVFLVALGRLSLTVWPQPNPL